MAILTQPSSSNAAKSCCLHSTPHRYRPCSSRQTSKTQLRCCYQKSSNTAPASATGDLRHPRKKQCRRQSASSLGSYRPLAAQSDDRETAESAGAQGSSQEVAGGPPSGGDATVEGQGAEKVQLPAGVSPEDLLPLEDLGVGLTSESRVLLVGANARKLLPDLQDAGINDILVVEEVPAGEAAEGQPLANPPPVLGNERAPRFWQGSITDLPFYQGPFDAINFTSEWPDDPNIQHDELLRASLLIEPGGIICGVLLGGEKQKMQWEERYIMLIACNLPVRLIYLADPEHFLLQVPPGYQLQRDPVLLEGEVTTGFGRGSKQMGTPTANLPTKPLLPHLDGLPLGVYFGWARVDAGPGQPAADSEVHEMVMNIGMNPTVQDPSPEDLKATVEIHVMHTFAQDFYGKRMRAVMLGFLRPETKFKSVQELIAWINRDKGLARAQLKSELHAPYCTHEFLTSA